MTKRDNHTTSAQEQKQSAHDADNMNEPRNFAALGTFPHAGKFLMSAACL